MNFVDPTGYSSLALDWAKFAWPMAVADGFLPIGDAVYAGGLVVLAIVDGVLLATAVNSDRLQQTGAELLNNCNGQARREFPTEWLNKTYEEICEAAREASKALRRRRSF